MEVNFADFKLYQGNCLDVLKQLPDESVQCCVTSPPYYGLRDYGTGVWVGGVDNCPHRRMSKFSDKITTGHAQSELIGNVGDAIYKTVCPLCGAVRVDEQIGLEETPDDYISNLVSIFREIKRVLKNDGTLWVNIGDSYGQNFRYGGVETASDVQKGNRGTLDFMGKKNNASVQSKNLMGVPWRLAFALQDDGWILRQDIIWVKPNPMPESVKDRCTKSHEYLFLLSKRRDYFFDNEAIAEEAETPPTMRDKNAEGYQADYANGDRFSPGARVYGANGKRNKRDVWTVGVAHNKYTHFATFPEKLVEPCILAGTRKGDTVIDCFSGSGTTGVVAVKNQRNYIGIDLNPDYNKIAEQRIRNEAQNGFLF